MVNLIDDLGVCIVGDLEGSVRIFPETLYK